MVWPVRDSPFGFGACSGPEDDHSTGRGAGDPPTLLAGSGLNALEETGAIASTVDGLTRDEIEHFLEHGYVGPFTLCSPEEMAPIMERVISEVMTSDSPHPIERFQSRHLDSRIIYDLCAHPEICTRIASLYGPDLGLASARVRDA